MKCKNPNCNKELKKFKKKYCSNKCQQRDMYERKKEIYKKQSREWKKLNPEKYRGYMLKASKKFRTEKKERFNELMRKHYYKNKKKWGARVYTKQILVRNKKKPDIDKFCKKCKRKDNLSLKFEVYPNKAKEIRQAIKDSKIYYLCKRCRYEH